MPNTFDIADHGEMVLFAREAIAMGFNQVLMDPKHALELYDEIVRCHLEIERLKTLVGVTGLGLDAASRIRQAAKQASGSVKDAT